MRLFILITVFGLASQRSISQTFTMSNSCTRMLASVKQYNSAQMYDSALAMANGFTSKCKTKDAKFKGESEKAHALNALEKYSDALEASNIAIKANKTWIAAFFERAVAYAGLGQMDKSKADYETIVRLSEKNRDQASRSTIYSMLGDIMFQQGQKDSAYYYVEQAYQLDPRPEYFIQFGDLYYKDEDYDKAFEYYDKAVAAGKADYEMYSIRSAQRLRIYQKKYGTENVNELVKKMSAQEKRQVCTELDKLKSFGEKNMRIDLLYAFMCE